MAFLFGSGSFSKSSFVKTTYWPLLYSYPFSISSYSILRSQTGHILCSFMRDLQSLCSWLNEISLFSVAEYNLTGMLTIPNVTMPLHIALAAIISPASYLSPTIQNHADHRYILPLCNMYYADMHQSYIWMVSACKAGLARIR